MVPATVGSNETRKTEEWSQTTPPLHQSLIKPDQRPSFPDTQPQTLIAIEIARAVIHPLLRTPGGTMTNVTEAVNVSANVTLVGGGTANEVESLPVVVTGNGLWCIMMMDASAKIVVRMTATADSVSVCPLSPFRSRPCSSRSWFLHFSTGLVSIYGFPSPPGVPKSSDPRGSVTPTHPAPSTFILHRPPRLCLFFMK